MRESVLKYKTVLFVFFAGLAYMLFFSRYGIDIHDEGFHLYVSNMILKGLVPYRDFPIHSSPGSFFAQALIFKIFSPSLIVGRLSVVAIGTSIIILLFNITKYLVSSIYFAVIPSILFIFWGVSHLRHPWYGWYGLLTGLLFAYFMLKYIKIKKNRYLFLAGLFCGITIFMKQNLGTACVVSYGAFLMIDTVFSKCFAGEKIRRFSAQFFVFFLGCALSLGSVVIYFYLKGALPDFFYYVFKFALTSAKGRRFIFNPYPHLRTYSLMLLPVFFAFAYFLYNSFWGNQTKKRIFSFLNIIFICSLLTFGALFIIKINEVDQIYLLDRIKLGAVNGFFNLSVLAMSLGVFFSLKEAIRKRGLEEKDKMILFVALFSVLYTWSALCISRDHLHLVLGMPPAYVLIGLMFYEAKWKLERSLVRRGKNSLRANRFANITVSLFPLMFLSYFGFFTSLKNEGFRSVSEPLVNMKSRLNVERGKGIIVTEKDKLMVEDIVGYVEKNTKKQERLLGLHKSLLFNFLSDRMQSSPYYYLHPDLFRSDWQEDIIQATAQHKVDLVTIEKYMWDNKAYYEDESNNPLTFRIWRYIVNSYEIGSDFGRYYILKRVR